MIRTWCDVSCTFSMMICYQENPVNNYLINVKICTRHDVSCDLSMSSRYQENHGKNHWIDVKNILKFLRRTKDMFLFYSGKEEISVKGYSDVNFQTERFHSCSQSGFVFLLNRRAMSWRSSKQYIVANLMTKPEYIAANQATKEDIWLKKFINNLSFVPNIDDPVEIFYDNKSATTLNKEPISYKHLIYILRKYKYITKFVEKRRHHREKSIIRREPCWPVHQSIITDEAWWSYLVDRQ